MNAEDDWFFGKRRENEQREKLKREAQEDLKLFLQNKSIAKGRRGIDRDENVVEISPTQQNNQGLHQNNFQQVNKAAEKLPDYLPDIQNSRNNTYELSRQSHDLVEEHDQPKMDDDERFFLRRLRAAVGSNPYGTYPAYGQYLPLQLPGLYQYPMYNQLPPHPGLSTNTQPQQLPAINQYQAQIEPFPRQTVIIEDSKPVRNTSAAQPTTHTVNHRRGIVNPERLPDWQREELTKKQQKLAENQLLLQKQMEERERQKKLEKERQKEEERRELERIEKEQRELEEKYKREIIEERERAEQKESEKKNLKKPKDKNEAREFAQNAAAEKLLEARREAEELKKQKFQGKMKVKVATEEVVQTDQPDQLVKQESEYDRPIKPSTKNNQQVENNSNVSAVDDQKTRDLIQQLERLRADLERERMQIQQQTNIVRLPSRQDNDVMYRTKKPIDFVITEEYGGGQRKPQLQSTSIYIPLGARIADVQTEFLIKPSKRLPETSSNEELFERLAGARLKRQERP